MWQFLPESISPITFSNFGYRATSVALSERIGGHAVLFA
jgi:hypothetical protein